MLIYKKFLIIFFILLILTTSCSGKAGKKIIDKTPPKIEFPGDKNMEILENITMDLPEEMRNVILADIDGFILQISPVLELTEDTFLQADKQNFLGADYSPDDIVMLTDYPELSLSRNNHSLREILIPDLLRMVVDARNEGLDLLISSTFRTYEYQDKLFTWNVEQNGLETAERESARPGTSQHQLGTAIDFGSITDEYAFTPPGLWLLENAWEYGFSLSYPNGYEYLTGYRYECWHFRYITPEAAKLQKDYFGDIQYYLLSFLNKNREELKSLI
ncbi:MAG: M15 family metallopeptidase [Spirochaetia bacterium]|nr:M15 family metallopeptidase [Spirochaetia bacterium]